MRRTAIRYGRTAEGRITAVATAPNSNTAAAAPAGRFGLALANPQFRLLFIGNVVTMMGFGMMQVMQGVLAFRLTHTNSSVGLVAMCMGIPMLLLGPIGGALSDRMSKRMLLMFGQAAVGGVFLMIGLFTAFDIITIWILAGMTLLMGCTFVRRVCLSMPTGRDNSCWSHWSPQGREKTQPARPVTPPTIR